MIGRIFLFVGAVLLLTAGLSAQSALPPAPTAWVTDNANFMSPAARAALNARLADYERQTGHQLIVWIGTTSGDMPINDFAVRAFEKWKIGRKGFDDGLVLFMFAQDRKAWFEVGLALEEKVPDVLAGRIVRDLMAPQLQAGNPDAAIASGMDAIVTAIEGRPLPAAGEAAPQPARRAPVERPMSLARMIFYGIIGVIVLIIFITNPSLVLYLLAASMSGGRHGGGWGGGGGGGGGFSGGGGRSGGGGAGGSW